MYVSSSHDSTESVNDVFLFFCSEVFLSYLFFFFPLREHRYLCAVLFFLIMIGVWCRLKNERVMCVLISVSIFSFSSRSRV